MHVKLLTLFILIASFLQAEVVEKEQMRDREISVRKAIDTFGKIDQKDISAVDQVRKMFTEGKVTGQVRSVYAGYRQRETGAKDSYATAIGGMLKYELASLHGFNAGVAFTTSQDINFLTGDMGSGKHNDELSSPTGDYSALSEAYVNYKNGSFNFRAGRQMIDTPLADTDDSRMVPNTFEAYMLTYKINNFILTAGNVQKWQGAGAGLGFDANGVQQESNWIESGSKGTWMSGISYDDNFELHAWYYDITHKENASHASYFDIGNHTQTGEIRAHASLQYLYERESCNSGVEADIYGALFELVMFEVGFNIAYNKSKKHEGKRSFSGIGGGSLYTNMDTMLLDDITQDREAEAIVVGLVYEMNNWNFLYAYGDFKGDANSNGIKVHITEQNMGFEYSFNEEFVVAGIFVKQENRLSSIKTSNDWDRMQVMVKYNF